MQAVFQCSSHASNANGVSVFVPESNANGVSLLFSLCDWLLVTPCNNSHSLHLVPDVSVLVSSSFFVHAS